MMKKQIGTIMMIIAYAIILIHIIAPHHQHHHDNEFFNYVSGDYPSECNEVFISDQESSQGLIHALSHFVHPSNEQNVSLDHDLSRNFSKHHISFYTLLSDNFSHKQIPVSPSRIQIIAEYAIYISPQLSSSGLRAPPVYFS